MARTPDDDQVPRLPRGRGLTFSFAEIVRILVVATALIALLVLQKPCADSVSKFVTGFGGPDAGVPTVVDAAGPPPGVILRADMTPEQQAAAIAAARGQGAIIDAGVALDAGAAPDDSSVK